MKILNILVLLLSINGISQSIQGKYTWCDASNAVCSEYSFKNNKFEVLSTGHVGIQFKDKGYYFVSNDTLILTYDNPVDNRIKIISKERQTDTFENLIKRTSLNVEIINSDNSIAVNSFVSLLDREGKPIKGFMLEKGKTEIVLSDIQNINQISFAGLNDEVRVNFNDFQYFDSKIQVVLSSDMSRTNYRKGLCKYLIRKEKKKEELRLLDIKNNQLFILEKK